jgi:hypothetical protein
MATFTKAKLSASTNGRGILITGTSSGTANTIHAAVSSSSSAWDEIWIYAMNNHTASVALTIQWGGTTAPDDSIVVSIPSQAGLTLVVPGLILQDNGAGVNVKAYTPTIGGVVTVHGFVNSIA